MDEIQSLSDAQLRDELIKRGVTNLGPVCGTSRGVYEKKLFKLRTESLSQSATAKGKVSFLSYLYVYFFQKVTASTPAKTLTLTRSTRKTGKKANKSESEGRLKVTICFSTCIVFTRYCDVAYLTNYEISLDGSDDEIQVVAPKATPKNVAPSKPVTSTPTKERSPSPPASR